MAVYVGTVMLIKASTWVFRWPINRCWCFHLIHTGLLVVTAGYMALWQLLIWCLRHHHHHCHHLLLLLLLLSRPALDLLDSFNQEHLESFHSSGQRFRITWPRGEGLGSLSCQDCQKEPHLSCAHRDEKVTFFVVVVVFFFFFFSVCVSSQLHHVFSSISAVDIYHQRLRGEAVPTSLPLHSQNSLVVKRSSSTFLMPFPL